MKYYLFKSKRIPWVAGNTENVQLDFLPTVGRNGGRMVIDRVNVYFDIQLTVLVTGAQNQADFGSYVKQIRIFDAEGDRRLLTGRQIYLKALLDIGERLLPFNVLTPGVTGLYGGADVDGALDLTPEVIGSLPIFFTQPIHAHRDKDSALPVDDLLNGGGIELTMPAVGELVGTTDFTSIDAGSFYEIHVTAHEAHDMEYFARDVVRAYAFPSGTEFMVPVSGKKLRELVAFDEATTWAMPGGASIDNIATVTCEPYNFQNVPARFFSDQYSLEQVWDQRDLVSQQVALPIVFPGYDGKIPDMRRIGGLLFVQFGGAAAAVSFLVHTLTPKSAAMAKAAAASNRLAVVDTEVRTKGKSSSRNSEKFRDDARFMPAKQRGGLPR